MKIQGSIIKEQGVTFAIVVVKKHVVDSRAESDKMIASIRSLFPNMPIILMAQNAKGTPSYYGRKDIVNFLANISISQIPWKEYTIH